MPRKAKQGGREEAEGEVKHKDVETLVRQFHEKKGGSFGVYDDRAALLKRDFDARQDLWLEEFHSRRVPDFQTEQGRTELICRNIIFDAIADAVDEASHGWRKRKVGASERDAGQKKHRGTLPPQKAPLPTTNLEPAVRTRV